MASNNFFLNNDPLLYQTPFSRNDNEEILKKQLNDSLNQYKILQQQAVNTQKDYVGELDKLLKEIDNSTTSIINNNSEYQKLNSELSSLIQNELVASIKWKINNNPNAVKNIENQIELITKAKKSIEEEQRQSLNELNDYVKNYSNITFDEYKKIKDKKTE